jgi:hypothetical protein
MEREKIEDLLRTSATALSALTHSEVLILSDTKDMTITVMPETFNPRDLTTALLRTALTIAFKAIGPIPATEFVISELAEAIREDIGATDAAKVATDSIIAKMKQGEA